MSPLPHLWNVDSLALRVFLEIHGSWLAELWQKRVEMGTTPFGRHGHLYIATRSCVDTWK
jgi:hypothetical protein